MDFYIDIGIAAILRILKDRRSSAKYADALAKVYVKLRDAVALDQRLQNAVERQEAKQ